MKNSLKIFFIALLLTFFFLACDNRGSVEKAGERVDEVIDNAKDGDPLLKHKGPLEKAGEAVDDMTEDVKKKLSPDDK